MEITKQHFALRFGVLFKAVTGLMIRSGRQGEFTDSAVETTGDDRLHINGYVWASLLRRALSRCTSGADLARTWGKYEPKDIGVAPLWTEAVFLEKEQYLIAVNPGIRIHREWGAPDSGALYSDELAYPLHEFTMSGTAFFENEDSAKAAIQALQDALHIIGQGIETIGGGWSYGFGRLKPQAIHWAILDLTSPDGRKKLWQAGFTAWEESTDAAALVGREPEIESGREWQRITVKARIASGQLLAIHTDVPELGVRIAGELPDTFVFTRPVIENGIPKAVPVITGKAFRQAVLSCEIERMLRSTGGKACLNTSDATRTVLVKDPANKRHCLCKRCLWFGDTDGGGIISVGDALVKDWASEVIHRVQLCEHSMQNVHLFNGEYLTKGTFIMDILIDCSRPGTEPGGLEVAVKGIIEQMKANSNAPPGWYRLGATATCTGQLEVVPFDYSSNQSQGGTQ